MEGEETDVMVVVSVNEEAPVPEESAVSGSADALQPPEGDARPHEVTMWNCILRMETAQFNSALKMIFICLLCFTLWFGIHLYSGLHCYNLGRCWIIGLFTDGINSTIAVLVALFALCVDVKRPVPKWMVQLTNWTRYNLTKCIKTTTTELLPPLHKAALKRYFKYVMDWPEKLMATNTGPFTVQTNA